MRTARGLLALLPAVLLFAWGAPVSGDAFQRESLFGLGGVGISVEFLGRTIDLQGSRLDRIREEISERLTKAGVEVLSLHECAQTEGLPVLSVTVRAAKCEELKFYSFAVSAELRQVVSLLRSPSVRLPAVTWSSATGGYVGVGQFLPLVQEAVLGRIDAFIEDYSKANLGREVKGGAAGEADKASEAALPAPPFPFECRVTTACNVFSGPGGVHELLGALTTGERISVLEEQNGWYHFAHKRFPDGWVHKSFVQVADHQTP